MNMVDNTNSLPGTPSLPKVNTVGLLSLTQDQSDAIVKWMREEMLPFNSLQCDMCIDQFQEAFPVEQIETRDRSEFEDNIIP